MRIIAQTSLRVKNYADVVGLIAQFTHRLCKEENLKLTFCGTGEKKIIQQPNMKYHFIKIFKKNLSLKYIKQEKHTHHT